MKKTTKSLPIQHLSSGFGKKLKITSAALALTLFSCQSDTESLELESSSSNDLSSKSVELGVSSYSASGAHARYPASNAFDGSTSTRWTSNGVGEYLDIDLGENNTVDYLKIAHHRGTDRTYNFKIYTKPNGGSFTQVGNKSNDSSNSLQTYDVTNSTARYIRIEGNGNTSNNWTDITEVEVYGTGDESTTTTTTTTPTTGDTPGAVLGIDNDDWKLNGFTASPSSSATYYDDVMDQVNGNISTWSNSNYFYEDNGWAYFKCYRGLGSSENSGNPRVELRELEDGDQASWNGDSGTHTMSFTVRVDQLPIGYDSDENEDRTTGTVCFGQIHGPSGTNSDGVDVDDTIRLQFDGSAGQTSGSVKLKISGYITEDHSDGGSSESFEGYSLNTSYDVQIIFSNDRVSVNIDGDEVFGRTMDTAGNGSYFKAGNYLQSVQEGSFNGSFGLVGIKNLTVSH